MIPVERKAKVFAYRPCLAAFLCRQVSKTPEFWVGQGHHDILRGSLSSLRLGDYHVEG